MSIASEITRLQTAKAAIKTAIENKGVTVSSSDTLDDYADLIDSISGGGGGGGGGEWENIARGMIDKTTEFTVPSSISVNISNYLFSGRTGLLGFTIPSGTTTIPMSLCDGCAKLQSVEIPDTVTKINQTAFQSCGLTSITIPSGVTSLGAQCFTGCRQLTEVIMQPTTPPTFGANMFLNCSALASIYVPDASVSAYQAASGWSAFASKIKSINDRPTI